MRLLLLGGEYHLRLLFAAALLRLMRQLGIDGAVHREIHLMMLRPGQRPGRRRRGCTQPRLVTARTRHVLGIAAWTARRPHAAHRHLLVHERVRVHRRLAFYRDLEKNSGRANERPRRPVVGYPVCLYFGRRCAPSPELMREFGNFRIEMAGSRTRDSEGNAHAALVRIVEWRESRGESARREAVCPRPLRHTRALARSQFFRVSVAPMSARRHAFCG